MDAGASGGAKQLLPIGKRVFCVECGSKHEVLVATDWQSCERCTCWTCATCCPTRLHGSAHSNWCRLCREGGTLESVKLSSIDGEVVGRVMANVEAGGAMLINDLAGDPLNISRASGVIKVVATRLTGWM